MGSFPLRQRAAPEGLPGVHPLLSSTACVQDASQRVLRLAATVGDGGGLRLRVSAGLGPASPTAGVMSVWSGDYQRAAPQPFLVQNRRSQSSWIWE